MQALSDDSAYGPEQDWTAFSSLSRMKNHWNRAGWWPGRCGYYWYLTFESDSQLHALAAQCQKELRAPYFDLVPTADLHMTLERVAFEEEIREEDLVAVELAGSEFCRALAPFSIEVGPLAGSAGAVSFTVSPRGRLAELRQALDDATTRAFPRRGLPENPNFRPHVGVAYCNADTPAQPIIETVRRLRELPSVQLTIAAASLVTLTRGQRAYRWIERRRFPLG